MQWAESCPAVDIIVLSFRRPLGGMGTPKGRSKRGTGYAGRSEAASPPLMPFFVLPCEAEPVQGERSFCRSSTGWKAVTARVKISENHVL